MHRRSKLTPALHAGIIAALEAGNHFETTCRAAGITKQAAYQWLDRGQAERARIDTGITDTERDQNGDPPAALERRYLDFFDAVERARAQAEEKHLANLNRIAMGGQVIERQVQTAPDGTVTETEKVHLGDWRASAWFLERAHTQRWGRRQTLEVSGPEGGPVQVDASDGARIAERLKDFLANVRNDPRIIEARAENRRDELIGTVPAAIEQGRSDDARDGESAD